MAGINISPIKVAVASVQVRVEVVACSALLGGQVEEWIGLVAGNAVEAVEEGGCFGASDYISLQIIELLVDLLGCESA